ncbi:MAG: phosphatidylglycerophosphatase A [Burkholderiaceae bacterium]
MTTSAAEQRAPAARANLGFMRRRLSRLLGLGFGSGLLPKAPGTWGTLFAWICFAWLDPILGERGWSWWLPIAFVAGIWACARTAEDLGDDDPGVIVWDEIVAFWCVLFVLGGEFSTQLGAFAVFRVFDTLKPPPIGFVDARVKGGFGIMLDDIVAAAMTLFVFAIWRSV